MRTGVARRNAQARVIRDGRLLHEGDVSSLNTWLIMSGKSKQVLNSVSASAILTISKKTTSSSLPSANACADIRATSLSIFATCLRGSVRPIPFNVGTRTFTAITYREYHQTATYSNTDPHHRQRSLCVPTKRSAVVGFDRNRRQNRPRVSQHANIYVHALGEDEREPEVMAGLEHANGYIRREVARKLQLRSAPYFTSTGIQHWPMPSTSMNFWTTSTFLSQRRRR